MIGVAVRKGIQQKKLVGSNPVAGIFFGLALRFQISFKYILEIVMRFPSPIYIHTLLCLYWTNITSL